MTSKKAILLRSSFLTASTPTYYTYIHTRSRHISIYNAIRRPSSPATGAAVVMDKVVEGIHHVPTTCTWCVL